jgi:hypothetical protein
MKRLQKPPLKRDFAYFMKIGLNSSGINPHRLKVGRDLLMQKLV